MHICVCMYKNIANSLAYRVISGGPLVCIFTKSSKDVPDGMTAAWSCPYDPDVLLLVLDKNHTTSENIRHTKQFVVAIPSNSQKNTALELGSVHGRNVGNKLEVKHIKTEKSQKFGFDVMSDALAYFECELQDEQLFSDKGICLSKVLNVYVKSDMWDDNQECFNPGFISTLHHVTGSTFYSGGELV